MRESSSNTSRTRRRGRTAVLLCLLLVACSPAPRQKAGDAAKRGEPIARIGDELIYRDDVAPSVAYQVYRREVDIYSLLRSETEDLVDERLLAREAERRGVSVDDLLRTEVDEKAEPATDADVDAYLAEHPEEGAGGAQARARIKYFLSETRREARRLALTQKLREGAGFEFLLPPPAPPRTRIDTEGVPARGPADAPVTLVHFATFTSPLSIRSVGYIRRLLEEFPGQIRWVHFHFLNPHDETGLLAAEFAEAAQERGVFWEVHDALFALDGKIDQKKMLAIARSAGIPDDTMRQVGIDAKYLKAVKKDIDTGLRAGVRREPVIYVNGRYFSSTFPYAQLRRIVAEELGKAPPATEVPEPAAGPLPGPPGERRLGGDAPLAPPESP